MSLKTTGRRRYRVECTYRGVFGRVCRERLILQVEEAGRVPMFLAGHISSEDVVRWRDASICDLTTTEQVET